MIGYIVYVKKVRMSRGNHGGANGGKQQGISRLQRTSDGKQLSGINEKVKRKTRERAINKMFEKVSRNQAKLRLALTGVSGAGKTVAALYIAYGMTGDWNKIAFIDTEHERGRFYAGHEKLEIGEFMYAPLEPPYSPERYKELVAEAVRVAGPDGVVIIDSLSHAWEGKGGVLEIKDKISKQYRQNSYTAWGEAGNIQNDFITYILSVTCHTIVTMRSKMEYDLVENDKGKKEPKKMGLAPIQRGDLEYEFDIVLNIDRNHKATASKDTTFLDNYNDKITPDLGRQLKEWLSCGNEPDRCADCGGVIKAHGRFSATEIIEKSAGKYGRKLCGACVKAEANRQAASQLSEQIDTDVN